MKIIDITPSMTTTSLAIVDPALSCIKRSNSICKVIATAYCSTPHAASIRINAKRQVHHLGCVVDNYSNLNSNVMNDFYNKYFNSCFQHTNKQTSQSLTPKIIKTIKPLHPHQPVSRPYTKSFIRHWTKSDVSKWIIHTCAKHSLPLPYPVDNFVMNGKGLLMLTKQDFTKRSKLCGDVLYNVLTKLKQEEETKQKEKSLKKQVSKASVEKFNYEKSSQNKYSYINDSSYSSNMDSSYDDEWFSFVTNFIDDRFYSYLNHLNNSSFSELYCTSLNGSGAKRSTNSSTFSSSSSRTSYKMHKTNDYPKKNIIIKF